MIDYGDYKEFKTDQRIQDRIDNNTNNNDYEVLSQRTKSLAFSIDKDEFETFIKTCNLQEEDRNNLVNIYKNVKRNHFKKDEEIHN